MHRSDCGTGLSPGVRVVKRSVLVVEDEEDIRDLVSYTLLKEGYQVTGVASGEEALAIATGQPPDLLVLDLMLPGIDGLTVCRKLRANPVTAEMGILMLTAKGEEADVVTGLNAGANDYIAKPFSRNVLIARVRAILRHVAPKADGGMNFVEVEETIRIQNIEIHPGRHAVLVDGGVIDLSPTEFRVLTVLARRPGWVFTREQILDAMHGDSYAITSRAIDVQIVGLRRRLGSASGCIETVRGVGYRLRQ